jgi:hypothetical protein
MYSLMWFEDLALVDVSMLVCRVVKSVDLYIDKQHCKEA